MKKKFNSYMFWYRMQINPVLSGFGKFLDLVIYYTFITAMFAIVVAPISYMTGNGFDLGKIYGASSVLGLITMILFIGSSYQNAKE